MSRYYRSILNVQGGAVPLDPDAEAFLLAAGITDATITSAINNLVLSLKADSIWTKMTALYPFVGGTASTHKFNLKNPVDSDAAFRLTFVGSPTHDANGVQGNGSSQYANTHLIPSVHLSASSAHFSKYNRTNDLSGDKIDGVIGASPLTFFQQNYSSANAVIGQIDSILSYTPDDTRGLFTVTRTSLSLSKVFKNSTILSTSTFTISAVPPASLFLMARNAGSPQFFNTYQAAFASYGDGLTDSDVENLDTAVTNFQTALSRNV
jgi:hypothetical protein